MSDEPKTRVPEEREYHVISSQGDNHYISCTDIGQDGDWIIFRRADLEWADGCPRLGGLKGANSRMVAMFFRPAAVTRIFADAEPV